MFVCTRKRPFQYLDEEEEEEASTNVVDRSSIRQPEVDIGGDSVSIGDLPKYLRKNRHLKTFTYEEGSKRRYKDRLSLFRVVSYKLDDDKLVEDNVKMRFLSWAEKYINPKEVYTRIFKGVPLSKLDTVEDTFNISIDVYRRAPDGNVYILRRSSYRDDGIMRINVDLFTPAEDGFHRFSLIKNVDKYMESHIWRYTECNFTGCNPEYGFRTRENFAGYVKIDLVKFHPKRRAGRLVQNTKERYLQLTCGEVKWLFEDVRQNVLQSISDHEEFTHSYDAYAYGSPKISTDLDSSIVITVKSRGKTDEAVMSVKSYTYLFDLLPNILNEQRKKQKYADARGGKTLRGKN